MDYRYRCVACHKEFTLHTDDRDFDPIEFDPACAWCGDLRGMPCFVPPPGSGTALTIAAEFQQLVMADLAKKPVVNQEEPQ